MPTIEVVLDEAVLKQIDRVIQELSVTRTVFIQQAIEAAVRQQTILSQERRHAEGYAQFPSKPDEFDCWETERIFEEK